MSDAAPKAFALILYVAALIGIGVLASRRTHSLRDYFVVLVSRLDPRTVDSPLNAFPGSRP